MENNYVEDIDTVKQIELSFQKLSCLKSFDKISRRNILKDIENLFLANKQCLNIGENENLYLQSVIKPLLSTLNDDSERCREIAAKLLTHVFDNCIVSELYLPLVISTLSLRLGKSDEREPSEEVRLLEIDLLNSLIANYEGDLLKYLSDITNILCACIIDSCPEIKRKGCEYTSFLSFKQKQNFHMVSSTYLNPLFQTICHQHFKTRVLCIYAVGAVIQYGSNKDFEQAVKHLAQRLFDHSPSVRAAVTDVIGEWLVALKDRYSFFHCLIPLILSALYDEVQEIRLKATNLWTKAGDLYLKENENDYKELIDFPRPEPKNYPLPGCQPSLGCRILVQRNLFNILPPLLHDLSDWVPETRLKSSKVLYSLILHAENKATIQLQSIIDGIIRSAKDEEKRIVDQALLSAELLGFFIEPNLLCDTIMILIHKSPNAVHLSVFAAILRGHKGTLPSECFQEICKLLPDPSIARVRKADEQANLLLCIEGLLKSDNKLNPNTSYQIFTVLSSVSGLTTNNEIAEKALSLMEELSKSQSCSLPFLFKQHALTLLKSLTVNNELWTSQNSEMPIFYFLVMSDYVDDDVIGLTIPILTNNLHPSKDAKLRSKIFAIVIKIFKKFSSSQYENLHEKIIQLIRLGVFPNLSWVPGKTASSLRTIAIASLYEIVNKNCISKPMLKSIGDELLPLLATLSDDDDVSNRLLACKIMEVLLPKLHGCVSEHKIHTTCYEFLQCMDDESDEIRLITTKVLKAYIMSFPSDYDWNLYRSHLKHMFENVFIHMDDKDEKIRMSVFNLLKDTAFTAPKVLLEELESKRYAMNAGDFCDNLIEHIRSLKM